MWEEDPLYQEGNYRLLVGSLLFALAGGFILSVASGDWGLYFAFLRILGVILAGLCFYAGIIWSIGHLALLALKVAEKVRNTPKAR